MKWFKFLLALAATLALIWRLQTPIPLGDKNIPAPGDFLNPFSGFWRNAEPLSGPAALDGELNLHGLKGKVQVAYDDLLIPHIFAENTEDAVRVQGYVTASQRLWQMDLTTRKAAGRLSEVLGERTLKLDRLMRRRGMVFAAEKAVKSFQRSPEMVRYMNAFTEGVNAYVDQLDEADYPLEFKLLGYKPEPWSVLKTALVVESMADVLCAGNSDLEATKTLGIFGQDTFNMLYPEWNPKQTPIVPDFGQWADLNKKLGVKTPENKERPHARRGNGDIGADFDPEYNKPDPYIVGSNNWAVSGLLTRSKAPLLANDPHLNLTLPSIWFQLQIHSPEINAHGVSLPGIPGIIGGFNENSAWGITNVGHDVSDWYSIQWADDARTRYVLDGQEKPVEFRYETIVIKGREKPLMDTVRYTNWGPIVYDYDPDHALKNCSLRWIAHDEPDPELVNFALGLNGGKNYDNYRSAIRHFDSPAQNIVFATKSGDIAITVQGRLPVRKPQQGRFIQDGSKSENGWSGFIDLADVPALKNPERGFVYSANQHSTPPSYPYYYTGNFDDYRGRHLHERLSVLRDASIDSMKSIQLDNFSRKAADALPVMLRLLDRTQLDATGQKALQALESWNYRYEADQSAPSYFEVWLDSCYNRTFDEIIALQKTHKQILYPEMWRFIELMETDSSNFIFDIQNTPDRETARQVVNIAFKEMSNSFAANPAKATDWAHFRGFDIKHLALLEPFSRMNLLVGGDKNALNAISRTNGPSWRLIAELSNPVRAIGVYPGGQSGNPGSRYYDNLVEPWLKGEYFELLLLGSADDKNPRIQHRQTFLPK